MHRRLGRGNFRDFLLLLQAAQIFRQHLLFADTESGGDAPGSR